MGSKNMPSVSTISRRHFLRADLSGRTTPLRPPWARAEARFLAACTRCDECLSACAAGILKPDGRGYPVVDFARGECTFCAACVEACRSGALVRDARPAAPWTLKASVGPDCLARRGVLCSVCREQCEYDAVSLQPQRGGVPLPQIKASACTGCGACATPCPTGSIRIAIPRPAEIAHETTCT
jgi:ferredoxin-type protein NapF